MSTIGELVQRDGKKCAVCGQAGRLFGNTDELLVVISGEAIVPTSPHQHVAAHAGCVEKLFDGDPDPAPILAPPLTPDQEQRVRELAREELGRLAGDLTLGLCDRQI